MAEGGGPESGNASGPDEKPVIAQTPVPSTESQKQSIGTLLKTPLRKGDEWYLIDSRWFKQWKKYVGFDSWDLYNVGEHNLYPGLIDNSGLFSDHESQTLKEHLIDELDYVLMPTEAWNKLVSWYGCLEGQKPIIRKVPHLSLYIVYFFVVLHIVGISWSLFDIPNEKETRLWNKYMSNTYEQLNKLDSTVQDAGLFQGQVNIMLHSIPVVLGYNSYSSYSYRESTAQPGLCGLSNLGNTCFMNSALQCLSNTPPLTEYFLEDRYEAEINRENPLGMRGEIAEAYADLVKQMWLSRSSYVAPRTFKTQVGRFAPQFSGYQQQDSQELLAFLLDGLHEDLNRVKKKPYLALRDAEGRPDEVVAKEAWANHRLRNDSIIVDIFHGLFKSTLVCPECSKVSVTFDPFCYLTLPLPMKKDRTMEVFLVHTDPQFRPMQYRVVVPKMGVVADLCSALAKLSGVPSENMVVADVYNHRFHKIYRQDDGLNHIMEKDDIFIYEVLEEDSDKMNLPVYFRERHAKHSGGSSGTMLFGQPLLITVPRHNLTVDTLYDCVLERIGLVLCFSGLSQFYTSSVTANLVDPLSVFCFRRYVKRSQVSPQAYDKHESMLHAQKKKTTVALRECIELFTTMETLGEHDPWYCPTCKKHQQATKKFDLWSLPRILVVHLKRFSYNRCWRDKLDTVVDFPIRDLNMSEFVCDPKADPYVYDLIAVSNHYGGMGGGHYTAYGKNKVDGKWYYFDDSSVSSATEDQIVTKAAYVLFYQRRDVDTPSKSTPSASLGGAPETPDDHMDTN
uniref:Ubiquitin carboxyl-terminal hydrolase n=1 Tax=Sinocyclocheilus anshuiensis TaxID=1608454 RepID=A0A671NS42_9TELE